MQRDRADRVLSVRLTASDYDLLASHCASKDYTISDYIRSVIDVLRMGKITANIAITEPINQAPVARPGESKAKEPLQAPSQKDFNWGA